MVRYILPTQSLKEIGEAQASGLKRIPPVARNLRDGELRPHENLTHCLARHMNNLVEEAEDLCEMLPIQCMLLV
jgi:hypothetical protein